MIESFHTQKLPSIRSHFSTGGGLQNKVKFPLVFIFISPNRIVTPVLLCAVGSVCVCEIHLAVMLTARQQERQDKCENNSKRRVKSEKFHLMRRRLVSTFSAMRSNDTCAKDYGGIPATLLYVAASMLGIETKSRKM